MNTTCRRYTHYADYERVGEFLVRTYKTAGDHINWLQPRWEYMHYHPYVLRVDRSCIGIWEANGEIVGVVHPEHSLGTAYFEVAPGYGALKKEMLVYAEENVAATESEGKSLGVYINDRDDEFKALASEMGYAETDRSDPMSCFVIPDPFPEIPLPDGFRLKSLAEDNNLRKLTRVLFRGFNHGDEPPDDAIEHREFMQSAPNYRKDLNIVVEAPDGSFVSYCGMWFESTNRFAYVEPVCTDPDYRRMGLASAAVLDGIRRCGEQGAEAAYVTTTKPLYLSIGFSRIYNSTEWRREWA